MKILYVENHPVFATTVVQAFLAAHEVTVVPSLAQARARLGGEAWDVLLVDFDLDDGKGDELVRELRRAGDRVPIVGVSSHREGNQALLEAGADAVCGKLQFDRIRQVLADLGPERAPGDAPPAHPLDDAPPGVVPEWIRYECASRQDAPSAAELNERVDWAHGAELHLPSAEDARALEESLASSLFDHKVFLSGERTLKVMRVLSVETVLAHADDLLLAARNFRRLATALARRLSRELRASLRALSSREFRFREGVPQEGELNRLWRFAFHGFEVRFTSVGGLVLDVLLGYPEEFGALDPWFFQRFVAGPFDLTEVSGVVRDDPRAVEAFLRGGTAHPRVHELLGDDFSRASRCLEVLGAAGLLEQAVLEDGQPGCWFAPD